MKPQLHFIGSAGPSYLVYLNRGTKRERFLGQVSRDPIRKCWANNHEPRTYRTRAEAAKALIAK